MTFLASFVIIAIGLLLYNFLSPRITPIILNLSDCGEGLVSIDGIEAYHLDS